MKPALLSAFITAVAGQVLYHLAQKSILAAAHPVLSLLAFYLFAALLSLPLFWLFPLDDGLAEGLSHINWATLAVAASIVLVELGFLLAYRGGANVQTSYIASAVLTTAALVLLGWLFFSEALNGRRLLGLGLAFVGIWLLTRSSHA